MVLCGQVGTNLVGFDTAVMAFLGAEDLCMGRCVTVRFDEAVQDRRGMEGRNEMRFDADWSGSHGGSRGGMVVNGEDKAGLLRRGRERSGCVRFYSVRYGRQGTAT